MHSGIGSKHSSVTCAEHTDREAFPRSDQSVLQTALNLIRKITEALSPVSVYFLRTFTFLSREDISALLLKNIYIWERKKKKQYSCVVFRRTWDHTIGQPQRALPGKMDSQEPKDANVDCQTDRLTIRIWNRSGWHHCDIKAKKTATTKNGIVLRISTFSILTSRMQLKCYIFRTGRFRRGWLFSLCVF